MNNALKSALLSLAPTGPKGFEGLIRDALSEVTGQSFGIFKSGPQGGLDGLSGTAANAMVIGFEGKRYQESTKLGLDELKAKIVDASTNYPSLDIWILAATRSVAQNDVAALEEFGATYGIDVLVLDWRQSAVPADIAILLANAPDTVHVHFPNNATLSTELANVRNHPSFAMSSSRLRSRLTEPSVGLDATRLSAAKYMHDKMSDQSAARNAFDSFAALEQPGTKIITRRQLFESLSTWWDTNNGTPLALLGREGMGKTWAALGWWIEKNVSDPIFPLTVVIPARDVRGTDAPSLIAATLHKITKVRDSRFWEARLNRWATAATNNPIILVVIDGLNQNWLFKDWVDFVLSISTPEWRGKIAIILSCRPDHWSNRLGGLPGLPTPAQIVTVDPFTDDELDELLALHNVKRDEFTAPLLELLRVPRLSQIAISSRTELQSGGDITAERLVFEDWRHRRPKAQQTLNAAQFQTFVAKLGAEAKNGIDKLKVSRASLLSRLSDDTGTSPNDFEHVLSELIDGAWLTSTGKDHQFTLAPDRVPAALGLALVAQLKELADDIAVEDEIAAYLDPLQGMDISVSILRNAVTFALLDPELNPKTTTRLLDQWLTSQNFRNEDFQAFWRMIGWNSELVINLAEVKWFEREGEHRTDELFVKGFSNAFKWPDVANPLTERLVLWFSRYWLDPLQGEVLGRVEEDSQAEQRRSKTADRAANIETEDLCNHFGIVLTEVLPANQAWGSYRAVELLSWLPRGPLVKVYTAWAISRAVMGDFRQMKSMVWNLRWLPESEDLDDSTEISTLTNRAFELYNFGTDIATQAGQNLIEALATPAATKVLNIHPTVVGREINWPNPDHPEQFADRPLATTLLLTANPACLSNDITAPMQKRLKEAADAVSPAQMRETNSEDDGGFEVGRLALARWAPEKLAELVRQRYAVDPPIVESSLQRFLSKLCPARKKPQPALPTSGHIAQALLVFRNEDAENWIAHSEIKNGLDEQKSAFAVPLRFASTYGRQLEVLKRLAPTPGVDELPDLPDWIRIVLCKPTSEDILAVRDIISAAEHIPVLNFWLRVIRLTDFSNLDLEGLGVGTLAFHENQEVRNAALEFIVESNDKILADKFAASDWKYTTEMDRNEAALGTLALSQSSFAANGQIIDRVHPDIFGQLTENYPEHEPYLAAFANHVRSELEYLRTSKSRSYPRSLLTVHKGWGNLLAKHEAEFRNWMLPFFEYDSSDAYHFFGFGEDFPLNSALDAYDNIEPGSKARFIEHALAEGSRGIRFGKIYSDAAKLKGKNAEGPRKLLLRDANDDQKLFDFAVALQREGDVGWLVDLIRAELQSEVAGKIARGITLAGFLSPSDVTDRLWQNELAASPAPGWLERVWLASSNTFQRVKESRHWRDQFFSCTSDEDAFAAFELMIASVDGRLSIDRREWLQNLESCSKSRLLHWGINGPRIDAAIKNARKALDKSFLRSPPAMSNQYPKLQ
jgi:hypothetical protein